MPNRNDAPSITARAITDHIYAIRGERVMLDADLAELYGVTTSALNQAVARNSERFPPDFAFRLTATELRGLKSRSVISMSGKGGRRSMPLAFTEEGVAMLSSVLRSARAVAVNVLIMRAFVQLRRAQGQYAELRRRIDELARRVEGHDDLLTNILDALNALEEPPRPPARPLGFRPRPPRTTSSARDRERTRR